MDPKLYNALAKGDVTALLQQFEPILHSQITYQKYTSLHVAVQFEKEGCVEAILDSCPSSLLLNVNTNGDTALHMAARQGQGRIIKLIIEKAKSLGEEDIENGGKESIVRQLIKVANKKGDSALHEAVQVRNNAPGTYDEMVKYLTEAYPEFEYFQNVARETPLYLAAFYKLDTCVSQILDMCQTSAHSGPDGTTAMHAAAMSRSSGIINRLHGVKPSISKEADKHGWTPLHYAACDRSTVECCESLIKTDSTVAYILDKKGMSPLHVAAGCGNVDVIKVILEHCPDCWQVLDHRDRNYLHVAALRGSTQVLEGALKSDIATKESLNHPDIGGNTPLHLAAICGEYDVVELLSKDNRVSTMNLNKENSTALGIIWNNLPDDREQLFSGNKRRAARNALFQRSTYQGRIKWKDLGLPFNSKLDDPYKKRRQKSLERTRNASNNHLVVAALIATVTFAAGFTIPGGYQSNNGQPIFLGKTMFKVFAISNTIAMVLSTLAVLTHFLMNLADDRSTFFFVASAFCCTFLAIMFMMLAFITGTFTVLSPSLGLAITTCVIGSSFYPLCYYPLNHYLQSPIIMYFSLRKISSFLFPLNKLPHKLKKYLMD